MTDERAVSDVVGFVLTFSLIIASVGLVATVGFDQLEDLQRNEQLKSSQNGMINLAESFEYVHRRSDLARQAGLSLGSGTVQFNTSLPSGGTPGLTVDVAGGFTADLETSALVYTLDGQEIVYEGGGLYYEPGGVVEGEPAVSCSDGRAVVSVLQFDTDQLYYTSGSGRVPIADAGGVDPSEPIRFADVEAIPAEGTITLRATHAGTDVTRRTYDTPRTVSVDYTEAVSPSGWAQFASRSDAWTDTGSAIECSGVTEVLVRSTTVEIVVRT